MNNPILIDQTLHGYASGHHLLASSIELSEKSQRKMAFLSDLSGPEIQNGFKEYYTGYLLPEDNKAVLSYTWYAAEMERPGCVWTHSLIIEPTDLTIIGKDIYQLTKAFSRPNNQVEFKNYCNPISFKIHNNINNINIAQTKLQYLVWAIWGNKLPAIISAKNSDDFAKEILYLWLQQNKDLEQGFSFSTGSLAIRRYESEILSLQVVPKSIANNISNMQNEYKVLHENENIKAFPVWVNKAIELQYKDTWNDLDKFRGKFGKKYLKSEYFVQFVKVYIGTKAEAHCLNVAEGLSIIEKIFPENEKKGVANIFIEIYLANELSEWVDNDCSLNILIYLVECKWLKIDERLLEKLINKGIKADRRNSKELVRYLAKREIGNIGETILLIYAKVISIEMFADFTDMELSMCSLLVTLNPVFAQCIQIWKQPQGFQAEILQCLKNQTEGDDLSNNLLPIIMDNSLYDFGNELYNLFGERCINIFLDYLLGNRILASKNLGSIKNVCKKHGELCLQRLKTVYNELDNKSIVLMLEIIDPYLDSVSKVDSILWIEIFNRFTNSGLSNENKMTIALFYFPIILKSNSIFPSHIVNFVFEILHASLSKQAFPNDEWVKIERILPEVTWYNRWDKCKRLRKAIKRKGYKFKAIEDEENSYIEID